ncbi:MAG: Lrp/AsnC family transcriptional regulator [Promethearchaeota archaeon]
MKAEKNIRAIIRKVTFSSRFSKEGNYDYISEGWTNLRYKINRLRELKIINNFTINIFPNEPINLRYVLLEIKTNPQEPELVEKLLTIPQLRMLDGIFGEFSLIALFIFESTNQYQKTLQKIDKIMAKSYFKKYQIVEPIKIFKTNGIKLKNRKIKLKRNLDNKDIAILRILRDKQSIKPLSTYKIKKILNSEFNINISQPTIYNRIKSLEKAGIILNYTFNFNPRMLGFKGKYILRIKPKDPSKYDSLAKNLEENINITDLFRIGDEYGLFAIVRVKEVEDYKSFIVDLYNTGEIEDTWTNFVLEEMISYTNFIF